MTETKKENHYVDGSKLSEIPCVINLDKSYLKQFWVISLSYLFFQNVTYFSFVTFKLSDITDGLEKFKNLELI